MKKKTNLKKMNAAQQVAYIKKALGYTTFTREADIWLKTPYWRLNKVAGSKRKGIAYGKCIVIAGDYSSGKTMLATKIAGMAQQRDNADVGYVDVENSRDPRWAKKMGGLDFGEELADGSGYTRVAVFFPEIGTFGKTKKQPKGLDTRLQTAEELFTSAEQWMLLQHKINPKGRRVMIVDSTTAIQPEEEMVAGLDDQNMRTRLSLPLFMNLLTKRWNQIALNTNTLVIYVAQLRINPNVMFGPPEKIPGGKGLLYYPSVIITLRRARKGGEIKDSKDNIIGLRTNIVNIKNKAGGGSVERYKCGFRAYFQKNKWKFLSRAVMKGKGDE